MRQLAGTLVLFGLISCAAATDAFDDESSSADGTAGTTTMAEVTVEGSPEAAFDLDDPVTALCDEGETCTERATALEKTQVSLSAPFLEVRAIDVVTESGGATKLAVRTASGWQKVPDELLTYFNDDPGCPSIEREFALVEIKVEQGALVILTDSDRDYVEDERAGSIVSTKARACREGEEGFTCSEPTVVAATLSMIPDGDEESKAASPDRKFATKYWVDADGEIETEHPFDAAVWNETAPGT